MLHLFVQLHRNYQNFSVDYLLRNLAFTLFCGNVAVIFKEMICNYNVLLFTEAFTCLRFLAISYKSHNDQWSVLRN